MSPRVLKAPDVVVTDDLLVAPSAVRMAIEDAFRQGCERGRYEATGGLAEEVARLRSAISEVTQSLRGEITASSRVDALTLVELSSDLVEWLSEGVIAADPSVLMESLQRALTTMADETGLVLHLHPDVLEVVGDESRLGVSALRADPTLGRSDFRLVADGSMIERRWRDLVGAMQPDLVNSLAVAFRAD